MSRLFLSSSFSDVAGIFRDLAKESFIRTGADMLIIDQINSGKVYIGESAGSIILSPNVEYVKDMDDYQVASGLKEYEALHVVDFFPLPHYKNFPFKKTVEKIIDKYTKHIQLFPITNTQAIVVNGNNIEIMDKY